MKDQESDPIELLRKWCSRARKAQKAYFLSSAKLSRLHYWTGIPVVISTTVVGSTVFGTLNAEPSIVAQVTVGGISLVAAILAALQTFLRFAERAEKHRRAAVMFSMLKNDAEHLISCPPPDRAALRASLDSFRTRMNEIFQDAPPAIQEAWDQAGE
jgi:hypothetical protein